MKIFTEVLNRLAIFSNKYKRGLENCVKVSIICISIITIVYANTIYIESKVKNNNKPVEIIKVVQEPQSMNDSVYNIILELNIQYPHIVMAQAIVESANFTSKISKSNNNIFGMKYPYQRNTVALDVRNGYARYSDVYNSILDYCIFQTKYIHAKSEHEYYTKLGDNYAEDNNYIRKVKNIADKLKLNGFLNN